MMAVLISLARRLVAAADGQRPGLFARQTPVREYSYPS
jgi:hypothetical protein